jgi:hypothetical protein
MIGRRLAFLAAGSWAVVALMGGACGGGDSGGGGSALVDPASADPLAHQALLAAADLPGSGWDVTKSDQFDDSGTKTDTAACKDIDSRQQAAKTKSDAGRAGRAEQELSRQGNSPIPTSVETQVNVFKDTTTPSDVLKMFQDAVKSSNFETCLKDSINGSAGPGTSVQTKSASALASAPNGGTAAAYDFSFSVQGQTFAMHYETHLWRYLNTGITVTVSGSKDEVTADLVKAAVTKTESKLEALPKQ